MPYKLLVFPCASGIGQEIFHSLEFCKDVTLYGLNSGPKHANVGGFLFENYIEATMNMDDPKFISFMADICKEYEIDAIMPALDDAQLLLKAAEQKIGIKVLTSCLETTTICRRKSQTYIKLRSVIRVPTIYDAVDAKAHLPLFAKPDDGEGSKGCRKISTEEELATAVRDNCLLCELLVGDEFTVDCFSNAEGKLLFCGPRRRSLTRAGLSVITETTTSPEVMLAASSMALQINGSMSFLGAWFFQCKFSSGGELALLEVAPRISGAMGAFRHLGVNFPLLTMYVHYGRKVEIVKSSWTGTMAKIYANHVMTSFTFDSIYVDLDDTLLIRGQVNTEVLGMLYECKNRGKDVHLITRHDKDVFKTLGEFALSEALFKSIIHLKDRKILKSSYFPRDKQIVFMDDSYAERQDCQPNVYACDVDAVSFVIGALRNQALPCPILGQVQGSSRVRE